MGLFAARFRFGGDPPTRAELAAHLVQQRGSASELEALEANGSEVMLTCGLDPITVGYAIAYLVARGGVRLTLGGGLPTSSDVPAFTARPWRDWNFLRRLRFRLRPNTALEPPITDGRYR